MEPGDDNDDRTFKLLNQVKKLGPLGSKDKNALQLPSTQGYIRLTDLTQLTVNSETSYVTSYGNNFSAFQIFFFF